MKQFIRNSILCLCFLLLAAPALTQVKIYVAPNGNNNNPGTLTRPFKTPERAIEHSLSNHNKNKDVSVELRQGVYYLNKTIVINAANFLPASLQITAYKNEDVTISAGKRLNLQWKRYKSGIYVAAVSPGVSFERLYINQKLQPLARYPNYDSAARVFHGTAADAIAPERVKRWKNPEGGYVHALHAHEWGGFHYRITGTDSEGNVQLEGGWQNNRPNEMHKQYRFVENIQRRIDR